MSYSLQNLIVSETYNQLVHTGSPNLTGNNVYTAQGCCIPYYITATCFDYCAVGYIKGHLVVNSPLSGVLFGNIGNVIVGANSCSAGKYNSIIGANTIALGGMSSVAIGGNSSMIGAFSSVTYGNYAVAIGTFNSQLTSTGCARVSIGGNNNTLSSTGCYITIGGQNNRLTTAAGSIFGGKEIYAHHFGPTSIITGYQLSATRTCLNNGLYMLLGTGVGNCYDQICEGVMYTGYHNTLCAFAFTNGPTGITFFTGKNNLNEYIGVSPRGSIFITGQENFYKTDDNLGYMITGLCNRLSAGCRSMGIVNGQNNLLDGTSTCGSSIIVNGDNNISTGLYAYSSNNNILNGSNNILSGYSRDVSIINGHYNTINHWPDDYNTYGWIGNGDHNLITVGKVMNGSYNKAYASEATIYNGLSNVIGTVDQCASFSESFIGTGISNKLYTTSGTIANGCNNIIELGGAKQNCQRGGNIIGGRNNYVSMCCCNKTIWSGENNYIDDVGYRDTHIIGGRNNRASFSGSVIGSNLSSAAAYQNTVNNLIITDLPVSNAGLGTGAWYRESGQDIIKIA